MQDFDPEALVALLRRRGWAGALSCNPPYVEEVFDRDLPRDARKLAPHVESGLARVQGRRRRRRRRCVWRAPHGVLPPPLH